MAHRSESDRSLRVEISDTNQIDLSAIAKNEGKVYLFHLSTDELPNPSINERTFKNTFDNFLTNLHGNSIVAFLSDSKTALNLIPLLKDKTKFRLWIAIERSTPKTRLNNLPDNHIALTVFSKNRKTFSHQKIQIQYTICPFCNKTTKDYGGKKHLYSPYGTLMADIWRDIKYKSGTIPREINKRIADLFAIDPFSTLLYFDFQKKTDIRTDIPFINCNHSNTNSISESMLYNEDCIKTLRQLPESSVDYVFADPPYNIKKKYDNWDDGILIEDYFKWCDNWIEEIYRVLKPGRVFSIINIPLWVVRHYMTARCLFNYVDYIAWEGLGLPVRNIMPAHYGILCLSKGSFRGVSNYENKITNKSIIDSTVALKEWYCVRQACFKKRNSMGIIDREPLTNLWWDIHRLKHNSKRADHPCQLPPNLMKRLIYTFSNENEIVLDPFNGAGTTTLVAELLGRRYLGIELSEKYHNIAKDRHLEIKNGIDPFRKKESTPKAKNSRVQRLNKQEYKVSKKVLQLEAKRVSELIGKKPNKDDIQKHAKFPLEYYENYFIDWGEVCAAIGDKGMREDIAYSQEEENNKWEQLTLLEKQARYKTRSQPDGSGQQR